MNNTPIADNKLDATLCLETMMHSDNPELTLRELTRVTKPGGIIIFNMSTSLGAVNNFVKMLQIEGLPRVINRFRERVVRDKDSSSARTQLQTREQIEKLVTNNEHTQLEIFSTYLKGLSTYIVLRKTTNSS